MKDTMRFPFVSAAADPAGAVAPRSGRLKNAAALIGGALVMSTAATQLPFQETFEVADGVTNGSISGQHGWVLESGTGDVQSDVVESGLQSLEMRGAAVSRALSNSNPSVWIRFHARLNSVPAADGGLIGEDASLAFFVNTNLNLVVYSNSVPVELAAAIPTNVWTRFDIYCDYDDLYWDLSMDGINVAAGLPLCSTNSRLGALFFSNGSVSPVHLDRIDVADTEPVALGLPDSDEDEIPDWWEQKFFGAVTGVEADDLSGNNGYTYLETYIAGLNPFDYDPFLVYAASGGNGAAWSPVPGRLYSVYWTPNLTNGFTLLQPDIPYPEFEYIDVIHPDEPAGFYRMDVQVE